LGDQRYRDRNTVERCARHLKEQRRLVAYAKRKPATPKRQLQAMILWAFVEEYLSR
jgi:hypothetical protein